MGGEGVAQGVWVDVDVDFVVGVGFEAQGNAAFADAGAVFVEKERGFLRFFLQAAAHHSPARQGFPRFAANEDETFDAAFAAHDGVAVCFGQVGIQRGEFGETQAG